MTKEQVIAMAREAGCPDPMVFAASYTRFTTLVRNAAMEDAKQLFSQPHQEYFGREAQDAIESLKEPTP